MLLVYNINKNIDINHTVKGNNINFTTYYIIKSMV